MKKLIPVIFSQADGKSHCPDIQLGLDTTAEYLGLANLELSPAKSEVLLNSFAKQKHYQGNFVYNNY
jgi:hypothetical protein